MVSEITTVRLWSQQTALKAFKDASEGHGAGRASDAGSQGSLADILFSSNRDDDQLEDTSLSRLIASLQAQAAADEQPVEEAGDGAVEDISSPAFMKALYAKLEELKGGSGTGAMADAMLAALTAGTLVVTDAAAGETITAWDPTKKDATVTGKTSAPQADWSTFLRDHLARDGKGLYQRNEDSSHKDRLTGSSAYFGMIGETYYYLSWTAPDAKPAASPSTATTS